MRFLILALPRSRTFWLSKFLSVGDFECGHEEARYLRTVEDAKTWLQDDSRGSCETGIAHYWRLIQEINPNIRIVVVRRPVAEVVASLMRLDMKGVGAFDRELLEKRMTRLDAKLAQIARRVPGVFSVNFADLPHEETARAIFAHCLPYDFDLERWRLFERANLQCNMRAMVRYAISYRAALEKAEKTAAHLSRAQLVVKRPPQGAVTFQQESVDDWQRDGMHLFEAHCVEVGEAPDNWKNKNWDLWRTLYERGALQITTARCNGKMFGYLMGLRTPSQEVVGLISGLHTTFYASRDIPGLGLKLQRASAAALRESGAGEVFFYQGVRGEGPRMHVLYERLGAREYGKLYRLEFEGV